MITSIMTARVLCHGYYSYISQYTFREFCAILLPRLVLEETASSTTSLAPPRFRARIVCQIL